MLGGRLFQRVATAAAAALVLCASTSTPSAHAFFTYAPESAIYPVAAVNRVSDTQLFARHVEILAVNESFFGEMPMEFIINTPGRVFISHVEKATTTAATTNSTTPTTNKTTTATAKATTTAGNDTTTVGKITISGSSAAAVAYIDLVKFSFPASQFYIEDNYTLVGTTGATDTLLIEIELYRKEMVTKIQKGGNSDIVVLENVLYTPRDDASFTSGILLGGAGNGSIFIRDPTATISTESMRIAASQTGSGTIQIELARLNHSKELEVTFTEKPHTISLFVDTVSPVTLVVEEISAPNSTLCIASKSPVKVTSRAMIADGQMTDKSSPSVTSERPSGATCEKKPLPERVPAYMNQQAAQAAINPAPPVKSGAQSGYPLPHQVILMAATWLLVTIG